MPEVTCLNESITSICISVHIQVVSYYEAFTLSILHWERCFQCSKSYQPIEKSLYPNISSFTIWTNLPNVYNWNWMKRETPVDETVAFIWETTNVTTHSTHARSQEAQTRKSIKITACTNHTSAPANTGQITISFRSDPHTEIEKYLAEEGSENGEKWTILCRHPNLIRCTDERTWTED